jgi:hypothetical protein
MWTKHMGQSEGCYWGHVGATHWELDKHVENPLRTSTMHLPTNLVATKQVSFLPTYKKLPFTFLTYDRYHLIEKKKKNHLNFKIGTY